MFTGHSTSLATGPRFPAAGTSRSSGNHYQLAAISGEHSGNGGCATLDESNSCTTQSTVGNSIFGPVPSRLEVEKAIYELQRFMSGLQSRILQAPGYVRLSDAYSMMQKEPAFKNMVKSISCDEAVWQAIQSNEAVQDLQLAISPAKEKKQVRSSNEEPDIAMLILRWIMEFTKLKILELVQNFGMLVNEMLHPTAPKEKPTSERNDPLEEKIRSSLLLSIIILLIVVLARSRGS